MSVYHSRRWSQARTTLVRKSLLEKLDTSKDIVMASISRMKQTMFESFKSYVRQKFLCSCTIIIVPQH